MITFYSGTPGSGKSLHVAAEILDILGNRHNVIANFPVQLPARLARKVEKRSKGKFYCVDNSDLTVRYLYQFAREHHVPYKEGQTTVVIDECAIMFNAREWDKKGRAEWLDFFRQHRKLGYNFILVAQNDRMIDRQIRANFEYNIIHRKATNFGNIGFLMRLLHFPLFVAVTRWYGVNEVCGRQFFLYHRKYAKIYDTYRLFEVKPPAEAGRGASAPGDPAKDVGRRKQQMYLICALLRARIAVLKEAEAD